MLVAVDMLDDIYRDEGFAARDNMVKSIAQALKEQLKGWDGAALARISATEYALLCPTDDLTQLKELAEVINSRIADLVETNLFDSRLVIPRFVINELQAVADSADRSKRARGRRGLDILHRLRNNPDVELTIWDRDLPEFAGQSVDVKLVTLAKHLEGRLVTNDYNLNKVARVHGVRVININDLANALKPRFLPGEQIQVRLVRPGEEEQQGVGYLDDGTMVVVEDGREYVGRTVVLNVTSVLQTSAGRMVFGRYDRTVEHNHEAREDHRVARS